MVLSFVIFKSLRILVLKSETKGDSSDDFDEIGNLYSLLQGGLQPYSRLSKNLKDGVARKMVSWFLSKIETEKFVELV
ncbi:hypothetical protein SORDD16_01514 [Streptococcus oralis]|uniref:Uncharacterized protein n=1 Tax=Streptococcus oralis TaxID=1303 RepID=A0A139PAR1_STROR|nr:hypothetical protein SORDD16_01514 [Streptococcus oralis]